MKWLHDPKKKLKKCLMRQTKDALKKPRQAESVAWSEQLQRYLDRPCVTRRPDHSGIYHIPSPDPYARQMDACRPTPVRHCLSFSIW